MIATSSWQVELTHHAIMTKGQDGLCNGWVLPIWNTHEEWVGSVPQQCYMTVVLPGAVKGPHLHKHRSGAFTCVKGDVRIILRDEDGQYSRRYSGESYEFKTIFVPPGIAAAIECIGSEPAYVLNMPSPAWRPDVQDEWPVENWNPWDDK